MVTSIHPARTELVRRDSVHRSVYVDAELFEMELERLWGQAWIYVGHESQIRSPGDYYATQVGRVSVILIRDSNGNFQVINNRCAHKGAKVLADGCGIGKKSLRCPYHGWIYRLDGSLRTVPAPGGYKDSGLDLEDERFHLRKLPGVASYRGFVFARLSADGPDLETFLGQTRPTLDNLIERSPIGEIAVAGPPLRYLHNCNWKMWLENLNDAMHPMVAHASVVHAVKTVSDRRGPDAPRSGVGQIIAPAGAAYDTFDKFGMTVLPFGHSYMGGERSIHSNYSDIPGYSAAMIQSWGEKKAQEILGQSRHNTVIYPSFTAKDAIQAIRVVKPVAVDRTIVETWHFRLLGAPDEMLSRTLLYSRLVNSSGSMVGPDDLECYRRIQEGLSNGPNDWVDYRRGLSADDEAQSRTFGTSDLVFRNQYRTWAAYMGLAH